MDCGPPAQLNDAFPHFVNGDVDLVLTPNRRLKLHSDVLRGASLRLEGLLTTENAAVLSKKALDEGKNVRYRIELVNVARPLGVGTGQLSVMSLDTNGKVAASPGTPRASMFLEGKGKDPSTSILDDWTSVLAAIYGNEIRIESDDLYGIISNTSKILDIVDYLELKTSILAPLELALLSNEQVLWGSIANDPIAWIDPACRLRSLPIFREAAIHIIGKWNSWTPAQKAELPPGARELCERKAKKFDTWKEQLERQMLDYRPAKLRYNPSRDQPKGKKLHEPHVIIWQALFMLNNWLARCFRNGMGRSAPDGGYSLYRMLADGGDAYCTLEEQASVAPLTQPARAVFAEHVAEMKADLQSIVEPAMSNELRLDVQKTPPNALTPFTVELRHCPWNAREAERQRSRQLMSRGRDPPAHSQQEHEADDDGFDFFF